MRTSPSAIESFRSHLPAQQQNNLRTLEAKPLKSGAGGVLFLDECGSSGTA